MALAYQQMAVVAGAGVQGMAVQFPAPAPGAVPAVSGHVPSRKLLAGRPSYTQQFPAKVQSNFYRAASFHKGTQPTTQTAFAYPAKFGTMGATAGPAVRQTMPAFKSRFYPLDPARIQQQLPSPAYKAQEKPPQVATRLEEKQVAIGVEEKLPQVQDVKPSEEDVESWRWILTISKPEEQVVKPNEDAEEDSQWIVSLARPAGCKAIPVTAH